MCSGRFCGFRVLPSRPPVPGGGHCSARLAEPSPPAGHALPDQISRRPGYRRVPGRSRSGHQQWSAVLLDRRPAKRGRQGGPGAGLRCSRQRRLSVSSAADHREPGSRGHTQGWLRARSADRPGASCWPAARFPMLTLKHTMVLGEVGLEGDLRPIRGALSMALAARAAGCTELLLPADNLSEARCRSGPRRCAARGPCRGVRPSDGQPSDRSRSASARTPWWPPGFRTTVDFADVRGQAAAKRALEVAAAGAHNILLIGPPGSREDHARPPTAYDPAIPDPGGGRSRPPGSTASPACLNSASRSAPSGPSGHHTTP